jgi:hypothetical protein
MGRDLTLYPKGGTREDLKSHVESLGFVRCKHWWDWPKGTLNYSWFDSKDFRSTDGVSADIYPMKLEEIKLYGGRWALHVRNLYSASWFDVAKLNETLRSARKKFGGTIKGDYGTNKYAPLWVDESTPISRGIGLVFERVQVALRSVRFALPQPTIAPRSTEALDKKAREFVEFSNSFDPSRVIYNGLVPFSVSMFEHFFSRAFEILISYDAKALSKRSTYAAKVDFSKLVQVGNGARTIEDVIAEAYTFQNLGQLNKAYKEWLDIDVRAILFKKKRIGNRVSFLEKRLAEIIEYRHGVVHRFELDRALTKDNFTSILLAVEASILEFIRFIEKKYKIKIDLDS